MRRALAVIGLVVLVAAPAAAEETDATATALTRARAGEALAKTGDFLGAVSLFKEALALDPRPEYQCNIGVAYYKAQDLPRAQLFLSLCLARGSHLEATFLSSVREVLVTIEDTLRIGDFAPVEVSVTPAAAEIVVSAWAADEVIVGSRTLWLPLGSHQLTVSARGYVTRVEPVRLTTRGARVPVTVKLDEPVDPPVAAPRTRPGALPAPPVADVDARPRGNHLRTMAGVATVATVVVGVASIGMYLYAEETAAEARGLQLEDWEFNSKEFDAQFQHGVAYFGLGITAVGLVASGVLWSRAPAKSRTSIGASPTGDGAAVWVSGTF